MTKKYDLKEAKELVSEYYDHMQKLDKGPNALKGDFVQYVTEENPQVFDFIKEQGDFTNVFTDKAIRDLRNDFPVDNMKCDTNETPTTLAIDPALGGISTNKKGMLKRTKQDLYKTDAVEKSKKIPNTGAEAGIMEAETPSDHLKKNVDQVLQHRGGGMGAKYVNLSEDPEAINPEILKAFNKHIDMEDNPMKYDTWSDDFENPVSEDSPWAYLGNSEALKGDFTKPEDEDEDEEDEDEDEAEAEEMKAKTPKAKPSKKQKKNKKNDMQDYKKATREDLSEVGLTNTAQVYLESKYGRGNYYLDSTYNKGIYETKKGDVIEFNLPNVKKDMVEYKELKPSKLDLLDKEAQKKEWLKSKGLTEDLQKEYHQKYGNEPLLKRVEGLGR